ncbi:MAG: GNAT family N-acetyltransferase [Microthrixaceae bacterium]|nr:GNAT family N-acetyltransferase [Acidimicrobiales bacterium]MCB9404635.1 GNAT family N-acetyltransferase [Microthrixaceae bacterium]
MVEVRRIAGHEGELLRALRLASLADSPGDSTTSLRREEARGAEHWAEAAAANASGPLHATFVVEDAGLVGAYSNRDGTVNVVGLWSAPGHRDVGVASALLEAVARWALREAGARRLRIWVVERNSYAMAFYEKEGFVATGCEIPYQPEPAIRQLEMVREL